MDTSTLTFCPLSPLRTPKPKKKKKHSKSHEEDSDVDSVTSVLTKDIKNLAQAVTQKFNQAPCFDSLASDDDFLTSVLDFPAKKKAVATTKHQSPSKQRLVKQSDNSQPGNHSEQNTRKKNLSSKAIHSKDTSSKNPKNRNSHTMSSESSSESDTGNQATKPASKMTPKNTNTSSSLGDIASDISSVSDLDTSSDSDTVQNNRNVKNSTTAGASRTLPKSKSDNASVGIKSALLSSGSPRTLHTPVKAASGSLLSSSLSKSSSTKKQVSFHNMSASDSDSGEGGKQLKKKHKQAHHSEQSVDDGNVSVATESQTESSFKMPRDFEMVVEPCTASLSQSDIQGKQLWLIQAPKDFNTDVLNEQTVNMSGTSIVCDQETEKQYEVIARKNSKDQGCSFHSIAVKNDQELVVGESMTGQMFIMDWIPVMPPVELVKTSPQKHRVPDVLYSSYRLFGSTSPPRQTTIPADGSSPEKKKKHKHKKKKTNTETPEPETVIGQSVKITEKSDKEKNKKRHHEIESSVTNIGIEACGDKIKAKKRTHEQSNANSVSVDGTHKVKAKKRRQEQLVDNTDGGVGNGSEDDFQMTQVKSKTVSQNSAEENGVGQGHKAKKKKKKSKQQ